MNKKQPISHIISTIKNNLLPRYNDITLCEQYAWWMLQAITKKNKATLLVQQEVTLTTPEQRLLDEWVEKQVTDHMPLQYLLGSVPFGDLELYVEPPILIPRMETEEWVLNLADEFKKHKAEKINILDLCTGSGCVALGLAHALPHATITASDINPAAITLSKKNATLNKITNATFIVSDLYQTFEQQTFNVITANPPYITQPAWEQLDDAVKTWEDKRALTADDDGLALIKKIITQAPRYLQKTVQLIPQLVLEIGYDQGPVVAQLMRDAGFVDVRIEQDLAGKDRVVMGRLG